MSQRTLHILNNLIASVETQSEEKKDDALNDNILKVLTWNIAGINNNPWEYYVCIDDKNYNKLMFHIESYLTNIGKEMKVRDILQEIDGNFFKKLEDLLDKKCDNFQEIIKNDVDKYIDCNICDFLSNKFIGNSRLISWPDRLLNTIDINNKNDNDKKGDTYLYRPTVINYYPNKFKDCSNWFNLWCIFMKDIGINILEENIDNKYAKKYKQFGDNKRFLFLNIILLAIFDGILVYMLFDIESKENIDWQSIKNSLFEILNKNKLSETIKILNDNYYDYDILFLQEVRNNFNIQLLGNYHVVFPEKLSKNNQTSIICLKKSRFNGDNINDITHKYFQSYKGKMGINHGDLIVINVDNYILISFHGDTGGMATGHLIETINEIHMNSYKDYKLIIGIDANTYYDNIADGKKTYSVNTLNKLIKELNINSCFNGNLAIHHTTNCPRTYLQPQLNKAVKKKDIKNDIVDFRSPKDFILFYYNHFNVIDKKTIIDNTGNKKYHDNVEYVIPSQHFPSDHAILSTYLKIK